MVQPVNLFALASQQAKWLAARQSAVAGNIANVNTPGYGAVDIEPFERVLDARPVTLVSTQPNHIAIGTAGGGFGLREEDAPDLSPSHRAMLQQHGQQGWFCVNIVRMGDGKEPALDMGCLEAAQAYDDNEAATNDRRRAALGLAAAQ